MNFFTPKHDRSQCTTSMQFVSKKTSRFRTERSICVRAWLECRKRSTTKDQGPSERKVPRTRTGKQISNLRAVHRIEHFTKAISISHHHENRTKRIRRKTRKSRKQKLYLYLSSSVSKNLQDACSHRADPTYRILLTPHSSPLAEKGPQRISRSSAGAASCVRRLSSRSACEWQKS